MSEPGSISNSAVLNVAGGATLDVMASTDANGKLYTWNNKVAVDGSIQVMTVQNAVGLAATNAWFPYPGSAQLTNLTITFDPVQTNVYYRLVYP